MTEQPETDWRQIAIERSERIERLQEQNTIEVQTRQNYRASLDAVKAALEAAEKHSYLSYVGPQGVTIKEPCQCSSCTTIRGIVAFLEKP